MSPVTGNFGLKMSVLPNGSAGDSGRSKLPQSDQHGQRPLQLAIQVDFIPGGHVQIVRSVGGAEGVIPDRVTVLQFGDWVFVPFLPVAIDPGPERVDGRRICHAIGSCP